MRGYIIWMTAWIWAALGLLAGVKGQGTASTRTGAKRCNRFMCVTGLHDSSLKTDTYTLGPPDDADIPHSEFGWIAIGFGTTMANTPMVIVWPNDDGTFTLSQRQSTGHGMPIVVPQPPRIATLAVASSFSNATSTSLSFTIPSSSGNINATDIIWAYSAQNPHSIANDAKLVQHAASGYFVLPLLSPLQLASPSPSQTASTAAAAGTGTTSMVAGSGSASTPLVSLRPASITDGDGDSHITTSLDNRYVLLAHAVCGALATMVFIPLGVLVPRYAKGLTGARWWLPVHGVLNGVLGGVLVLVSYTIARTSFHRDVEHTTHRILGLVLFVLVLLQIALGTATHAALRHTPATLRSKTGRGPVNFLHMLLGCLLVVLGWVQVYKGLTVEWPNWSGTGPPSSAWKAGWAVLVAVFSAVYVVGIAWLLPRQIVRERQAREAEIHKGETRPGGDQPASPVTPTKLE